MMQGARRRMLTGMLSRLAQPAFSLHLGSPHQGDVTHSRLGAPPSIANEECAPQVCLQHNLKEVFS